MLYAGFLSQLIGLILGAAALGVTYTLYLQRPTPIYRSMLLAWVGITLFVIAHIFRAYGMSAGFTSVKGYFFIVYMLNGSGAMVFLWNVSRFFFRIADRSPHVVLSTAVLATGAGYLVIPVVLVLFAPSAPEYASMMVLPYRLLDISLFTIEFGLIIWGGITVLRDDAPAIDPFTKAFVLTSFYSLPVLLLEFFMRVPHTMADSVLIFLDPGPFVYAAINIVIIISGLRSYARRSGVRSAAIPAFSRQFNLSEREAEVLSQIILGKSNKEIADVMFVSIPTVKSHVSSILKKTGKKNRVDLVNTARSF